MARFKEEQPVRQVEHVGPVEQRDGILSRSGRERVRVPWTPRVGAQGGRNLGGFERLIKIQHRRRRDWRANANGQFIAGRALIFGRLAYGRLPEA